MHLFHWDWVWFFVIKSVPYSSLGEPHSQIKKYRGNAQFVYKQFYNTEEDKKNTWKTRSIAGIWSQFPNNCFAGKHIKRKDGCVKFEF